MERPFLAEHWTCGPRLHRSIVFCARVPAGKISVRNLLNKLNRTKEGQPRRSFRSQVPSGWKGLASFAAIVSIAIGSAEHTTAAETGFPGLQIFTHDNQANIAKDTAGLRFSGQITAGLAGALEKQLLEGGKPLFARVILELDSEGGELDATENVVTVLKKVGSLSVLSTRVMDGKICASGCIALFMTGKVRRASTASMWVFHGACKSDSNVPTLAATSRYVALLESLGVKSDFTCKLAQEGYLTSPGAFILSGYELFHNYDAGVITELYPNWRPEPPRDLWLVVPR